MTFATPLEREEFILKYHNMVHKCMFTITNGKIDDDLRQEGWLALTLAVDRYDPNKGCTFMTYAYSYVLNMMKTYRNYRSTVIKPSRFKDGHFEYMTMLDINHFEENQQHKLDNGNTFFEEILADNEDFEDRVLTKVLIDDILNTFDDTYKKIALLYFGNELEEIKVGRYFGKSRSWASKRIRKIRDTFRKEGVYLQENI